MTFTLRHPTCLLLCCVAATLGCAGDGTGPAPEEAIPQRDHGNSVLLLLDARQAASGQLGHDLEWVNILRDRFGPFDVADVAALSERQSPLSSTRRLVVIPRRSLSAIDTSLAHRLDDAIRGGATVLVEMPIDLWGDRFGLKFNGIETRQRLPWPRPSRDARMPEPFLPSPAPLRLEHEAGSYWPFRGPLGAPRILETPTGRAMHWKLPLGRGEWIVLGFDFAAMMSALRQGRPDADGKLRDRYPPEGLQSADLVAAPALLHSDRAWLDRWLHRIVADDGASGPWPHMGTMPFEQDGWLVVGPGIEDRALQWTADPDRRYDELHGSGVLVDRSLGPAGDSSGRAFGSTPFHPLRTDGRLHELWEFPFHSRLSSDRSRLDPVRVWLRHNRSAAGTAVHVALPVSWERTPETLELLAEEESHRFASPDRFTHFWERRARTSLSWSFDGDELIVRWEIPPDDESLAVPPLLVPIRWQRRNLARWSVDGFEPRSRRRELYGRSYLVVESPRAPGSLRAAFSPASR